MGGGGCGNPLTIHKMSAALTPSDWPSQSAAATAVATAAAKHTENCNIKS